MGFVPIQAFCAFPWQVYVPPVVSSWPMQECTDQLLPNCFKLGCFMLLKQLTPSHSMNMVGHTAFGAQQGHLILLPSLYNQERLSFPGLIPCNEKADSRYVDIKLCDSGVVIGYQNDDFTHMWSAVCFAACSLTYPKFIGKVSSWTYFHLNQVVRNIHFSDHAVDKFECRSLIPSSQHIGTGCILWWVCTTDSSVSSGFLCSISTCKVICLVWNNTDDVYSFFFIVHV